MSSYLIAVNCRMLWLRLICAGFAIALAGGYGFGSEVWDFAASWDRVQSSHPQLAAARAGLEHRNWEREATRSLRYPQVDVQVGATRINDPLIIDLEPVRQVLLALHPEVPPAAVPAMRETVQDRSFVRGQLQGYWPLYTGGRIEAAQTAAEAQVRLGAAQVEQESSGMLVRLTRLYFGLQLARAVEQTAAEHRQQMQTHLDHSDRLFEEGKIARVEALHARVALDAAERGFVRAQREVDVAELALSELLGVEADLKLETDLFLIDPRLLESKFQPDRIHHHPILEGLRARKDAAGAATRAQRGRWKPEVFLFGSKELHPRDATILDPDWTLGIGLRFSLLDRNDRVHSVRAARAQERQLEFLAESAGRDLRTLAGSHWRALEQSWDQFRLLESAAALAEENLRLRRKAFSEGLATSLEVVDARMQVTAVATERLSAAYQFVCSLSSWMETSGRATAWLDWLNNETTEWIH